MSVKELSVNIITLELYTYVTLLHLVKSIILTDNILHDTHKPIAL